MTTYTPVQLALLLGYTDESRPGKIVRDYLRQKYPDHEPYERWELDQDQAADVIANVPRRDEMRPQRHPWLSVPWDVLEPVGALAVAAGQVEFRATVTLRSLLRSLDSGTARAITNTPSFSVTLRLITEILNESVIRKVDPVVIDDWRRWQKRAAAFMSQRNTLLHSVWSQGDGAPATYSLTRSAHTPAPDPATLTLLALEGVNVARAGDFTSRIASAIRSEDYQQAVISNHDLDGWIALG